MDLVDVIDNYIKNDMIDYAILIKGEWGSGKTFFIRQNVVKRYSNALYVPLNGVSSIDELSEKIYLEIIKSKAVTNKLSKCFQKLYGIFVFKIIFSIFILAFKVLKILYQLFFRLIWIITYNMVNLKFGFDISSLNKKDFYGILKLYKNLDNYILVIDDLERCNIKIDEVLGYLNDFVEHKNMKCIIVANEDELYKTQLDNLELKILTAIDERIEFDEEKIDKKQAKINFENLKNRIEYLYNDNNKYKIIKEKLIGKEYIFFPNLNNIYDNLTIRYGKKEEFYNILCETKKSVLNSMSINAMNNIRVLNFYFDNFFHIYNYIKKYVEKCKISKKYIYSCISTSIINGCICIKKGGKIDSLSADKKFDYISYKKNQTSIVLPNMFLTFDFVNEYLVYGCIEKSDIQSTIEEFSDSNFEKLPDDDPFILLNEYWFYSSKEINQILKELYDNIENDVYSPNLYVLIIRILSCLEEMGYKGKIKEDIILLIRNKISKIDNLKLDSNSWFFSDESANINQKYLDMLKKDIDSNSKSKNDTFIEQLLDDDNWSIRFYEYIKEIKNKTMQEKKFFSTLDYKKIISKLMKSNVKDVYYFNYSLNYIYDFSNLKDYYISDLQSLKDFQNELNFKMKEKNIKDPMLKYAFKILNERINNVITVLDND